jgi:hypothetical protein
VGLDGGDVRPWCAQKPHCAVMVGTRTRAVGAADADQPPSRHRLGVGHTLETQPQRRVAAVLPAPGWQMPQERPVLADGNDTLRALQREMSPKATPMWAWWHGTMRLTVWEP